MSCAEPGLVRPPVVEDDWAQYDQHPGLKLHFPLIHVGEQIMEDRLGKSTDHNHLGGSAEIGLLFFNLKLKSIINSLALRRSGLDLFVSMTNFSWNTR